MTVVIAILAISVLVLLHEMGHFFAAKSFGVKVEEFGIGLPPRVFGKRVGETIYSINALPIGGFVRMEGEEKRSMSPRSYSKKPVWQRFLIVAAGVAVFWIIAAVLFASLAATAGIPMAIDDQDASGAKNPQVRIMSLAPDSPALHAGFLPGDRILTADGEDITMVREVQDLTKQFQGRELVLGIQRGTEFMEIGIIPRVDVPNNQGAIGVSLLRTAHVRFAWYQAPFQGVLITANATWSILQMFGVLIADLVSGQGLPPGAQVSGPVGVVSLLSDSFALGVPSFVFLIALLSIYLAIFNSIPIPALDGGRAFFVLLEGLRRKPLSEKIEQRLILGSFMILIPLILWVTIIDIGRLF